MVGKPGSITYASMSYQHIDELLRREIGMTLLDSPNWQPYKNLNFPAR
jgi:hypothetical protein